MTKRLTNKEQAAVIVLDTINQLNDAQLKKFKAHVNSELRYLRQAVDDLTERALCASQFENEFIKEADNLREIANNLIYRAANVGNVLEEAHGRAREADQAET